MAWVLIVVAGLCEVAMAYLLKRSDGFTHLWPTIGFAISAVLSFVLLSLALKGLEVGTAYAVWTGIGAVGTVVLGILALGEDASPGKLVSIALILIGVVGLNLVETRA